MLLGWVSRRNPPNPRLVTLAQLWVPCSAWAACLGQPHLGCCSQADVRRHSRGWRMNWCHCRELVLSTCPHHRDSLGFRAAHITARLGSWGRGTSLTNGQWTGWHSLSSQELSWGSQLAQHIWRTVCSPIPSKWTPLHLHQGSLAEAWAETLPQGAPTPRVCHCPPPRWYQQVTVGTILPPTARPGPHRAASTHSLLQESCGSTRLWTQCHPSSWFFPGHSGQVPAQAPAGGQTSITQRCSDVTLCPAPHLQYLACWDTPTLPYTHTHTHSKCKEQGVFPNSTAKQLFTEVYAGTKLYWQINCSDPQARGRQTIALPQFTCWILFCLAAWSGVKGSCSEAGSRQQHKGRENTSQPKGTVGKLVIGPCVFGFRQASRFVFPRLEPRLKETRNY